MKKITILLSHIPNPRILKKIKALEEDYNINIIYWDRGYDIKESFEINQKNTVKSIYIKAPKGRGLKKLISLNKYKSKAIKELRKENPHIIHALNMDMLFIASLYKKRFNREVEIVYEVGDLPKYAFQKNIESLRSIIYKGLQYLEKLLTKEISKIIVTSPYFWEEYFSKFLAKDKYLFIPNTPYKKDFEDYRKKGHGPFTIGFVGSIRYSDQLKMLIDVVEELDCGIRVFIAGSGPAYGEILEYSKKKDFVEFYGPYNYKEEIVSLYEKVDCTYSVYDNKLKNVKIALPNRLYESIVCQLPIVVAKDTRLSQFVLEKDIGIEVSSYDKEDLRDGLLDLLQEENIEKFEENCRRIKDKYFYERNIEKLKTIYLEL